MQQGGQGGAVSAGSDGNRLRQGREGGAIVAGSDGNRLRQDRGAVSARSDGNRLQQDREVPINIVACVIDGCILVSRSWLLTPGTTDRRE